MKLLFEAPFDFDPEVMNDYVANFTLITSREEAQIVVCNPLRKFESSAYPKLEILATPSTGLDHIDLRPGTNVNIISLLDDHENLNKISASSEFTFLLLLQARSNLRNVRGL